MSQPPDEGPRVKMPMAVTRFRQILLWPLFLHEVESGRRKPELPVDFLVSVTDLLEAGSWKWRDRDRNTAGLQGLDWYLREGDYSDYSEIVYFHSYVRDFLYGGDGSKAEERPLRVFERKGVDSVVLEVKKDCAYRLTIERVELYVFHTAVAILVLEVKDPKRVGDGSQAIPLAEIIDLQSVFRMAFPRRWNRRGEPSECPLTIELKAGDLSLCKANYREPHDFLTIVRERAELPAASHLQYLLEPMELYGKTDHQAGYCYQPVQDQRIPSMTYLAVDDPRAITDWDYARLTFFDTAGESSVGSYSDEYLAGWQKTYAYDRFWQRTPSLGDPAIVGPHNTTMRTRWLCSGYGFVAVGAAGDDFYTGQIQENFHHHYFRMGLIAHFHRASILILRDALADATKSAPGYLRRAAITHVQERMVEFRSRYWFREVSTQLQGQEIFQWWSDRLGNQELFEQVTGDIDAAASLVRTQEVEALTWLAQVIGIVGLGMTFLALMTSVLALGFLHVGDPDVAWSGRGALDVAWKAAMVLIVLSGIFAVAIRIFVPGMSRWIPSLRERGKTWPAIFSGSRPSTSRGVATTRRT